MKEVREPIDPTVEAKCKRVLAIAFRGIHHVPGWAKRKPWGTDGVEILTRSTLDTFDADILTRLVIAAHDECVRVEVCPAMAYLRISLSVRARTGAWYRRHPTMEDAVEGVRKGLTDGGWNG